MEPSAQCLTRSFALALGMGDRAWARRLLAGGARLDQCKTMALESSDPKAAMALFKGLPVQWSSQDYLGCGLASPRAAEALLDLGVAPPLTVLENAGQWGPVELLERLIDAHASRPAATLAGACEAADGRKVEILLGRGWDADAVFKGKGMLEACLERAQALDHQSIDECLALIIARVSKAGLVAPGLAGGRSAPILARRVAQLRLDRSAGALARRCLGTGEEKTIEILRRSNLPQALAVLEACELGDAIAGAAPAKGPRGL